MGSWNYTVCATPSRDGNISVADCMPLYSVLKTVKINGGVLCSWCMKNSRLSTSIWSVTVGNNVSTLGCYATYYVEHRRAIHKCRSTTQQWISRLSQTMMQKCSKILHIFAYNGLVPRLTFLSASLYVSKRGAYWDRLCRDVVGRWLVVGCHARAL